MDLTVVICTWNRAELLDQTLAQMSQLAIPEGLQWEIVVVNNNCTDHTDEVIQRHSDKLPIRRIFEEKQGLSNARNAAIEAAKGELIVWTDDDVLVDKEWLIEYRNAAYKYPDVSYFGGPVKPWFEGSASKWLLQILPKVEIAYAIRDLGSIEFEFSKDHSPFGANYALRTEVQLKYSYDSKLGRNGSNMVSGEETAVISSIRNDGHKGLWLPNAKVKHFIPKDRQSIKYLRHYYAGHGSSSGREKEAGTIQFRGRPLWLWRKRIESEIDFQWKYITSSPEEWIDYLKAAAFWEGAFRGQT